MAKVDCIKDIVAELGGDANDCDTTAETLRVLVALLAKVDVSEIPLGDTCEMLELLKGYVVDIVKGGYTSFKGLVDKTLEVVTADMLDGVTIIGKHSFMYCEMLKSVIVPESVLNIDTQAFSNCISMTEITIGSNVAHMDFGALDVCPSLKIIRMLPRVPPELGGYMFPSGVTEPKTIIVPKGSLTAYQTANEWSNYADWMVEADE